MTLPSILKCLLYSKFFKKHHGFLCLKLVVYIKTKLGEILIEGNTYKYRLIHTTHEELRNEWTALTTELNGVFFAPIITNTLTETNGRGNILTLSSQ